MDALSPRGLTAGGAAMGQGSVLRLVAEMLHIARPVVYRECSRPCLAPGSLECRVEGRIDPVLAVAAYILCKQRSWAPWLISAVMDAVSMRLNHSETSSLTEEEGGEMSRRHSLLFLYLVRSPVYESLFRPICMFFFNRLWRHIPIAREIAETFVGVFDGLHSLHFYKAGS
jgi:hypothetical protein